jgi:hypothetical protein
MLSNMQRGYNRNVTVNFQMLLPGPSNTTTTYYFFSDPYDECPAGGGIGDVILANIYGYVRDESGAIVQNATVSLGGARDLTDANGFYNITLNIIPGVYNLVARKTGYNDYFDEANFTFSNTTVNKNITLKKYTPGHNHTITPKIDGYVRDELGVPILGAEVMLGEANMVTGVDGFYVLLPTITPRSQPIISIKEGFNNYYFILNFTNDTTYVSHNITMEELIPAEIFPTGPYTIDSPEVQEAIEKGEDFWISTREIVKDVRQGTFVQEIISIFNFADTMTISAVLPPELSDFVKLDRSTIVIPPNSAGEIRLTFYGTKPLGTYRGNLSISGSLSQEIPIRVNIIEKKTPIEMMLMKIDVFNKNVAPGDSLKYRLILENILRDQGYRVYLRAVLLNLNESEIYAEEFSEEDLEKSLTLLKSLDIPKNITDGDYLLRVEASYLSFFSSITTPVKISRPIYLYSFFGIPLWVFFLIMSFFSFVLLNVFLYKRHLDKKKRYKVGVDYSTLPKPDARTIKIGKIAETNNPAYLELERLTTHSIVAGATGMGKSISAQVIIEEALMKNVCVMVFDPTAQWSGMLRKCEDKKMLSFYPNFGLKPTDARGFPGNIRQIKDARQIVNVNKYIEPGHIQIFTLNKLDPNDIDIFIANVIRQVFRTDPKESPELKVLLVFDEVHRLLSKFGGSGEGFLQIERACREFRKWGIGVMLISQVLNDFVGEIKANINTEVQARTIEENDLERIRTKYGEEFLKSLVKAEIGVTMFQNAEYNKGRPYFVKFRPILHNTRRLSDEELEKYNKYNDVVDDVEYQIEQLETEKIDVFDLKMELKLIKDKIMTGNFSVVDIYLEGLTPRLKKQWEKIGKTPKKKEIELADIKEIKKSVEEAKKQRSEIQKKEEKEKKTEKKSEEVKEKIEDKQVKALTFDNGIMVSTIKELVNVLPTLDDDIYNIHVNDKKNDIAAWFEQFSKELSEKLKTAKDKQECTKFIEEFVKSQSADEKKE